MNLESFRVEENRDGENMGSMNVRCGRCGKVILSFTDVTLDTLVSDAAAHSTFCLST